MLFVEILVFSEISFFGNLPTAGEVLLNQLEQIARQNSGSFFKPIYLLDSADENNSSQLEQKLREECQEHFGKRTIIIRYLLQTSQCLIILMEFQENGHILRAKYTSSFIESNSIANQLQIQINKIYPSIILQKIDWINDNDFKIALKLNLNSLLSTIENDQSFTMINQSIPNQDNEHTLEDLEQQLNNGLKELKIRDINVLPQRIQRIQNRIKEYEEEERIEEANNEKEYLRKLQQLQNLVDKISRLKSAESSNKNDQQSELLQLKQKLSKSLAKMKIQDEKVLVERIQKIKQRIQEFQDEDRLEEAVKETDHLGKLEDIQNLVDEIAKLSSNNSESNQDNESHTLHSAEILPNLVIN
ncbi:unnamed protein product [Rotaria sordida]|uniref:Uncharacterized protein n=1 Tax=Rotaria sordida TaxID=392033 RepID=A0A820CB05_9BILA|nr:unnamed protein product [Rotaria sordida]CAF4214654.1 unnamed protein product [Rotaria sordida]